MLTDRRSSTNARGSRAYGMRQRVRNGCARNSPDSHPSIQQAPKPRRHPGRAEQSSAALNTSLHQNHTPPTRRRIGCQISCQIQPATRCQRSPQPQQSFALLYRAKQSMPSSGIRTPRNHPGRAERSSAALDASLSQDYAPPTRRRIDCQIQHVSRCVDAMQRSPQLQQSFALLYRASNRYWLSRRDLAWLSEKGDSTVFLMPMGCRLHGVTCGDIREIGGKPVILSASQDTALSRRTRRAGTG
jgi:hypothetical protein